MSKTPNLNISIGVNTEHMKKGLSQASSEIRDWSLAATGLTQGVGTAFKNIATIGIKAVTVSLAGMTAAFVLTARSGAEFEDSILRAFTIMRESSGATKAALKQLTDEALRLGSETLFSATEAAQGFEVLSRAGFSAQEAIAALGPVTNLAIVGNLELQATANIATASLFGFGIEAKNMARVTDVLSLASSKANTTIELLGSAMSFVAPVARSAGISIEETAAAIGILSNAGIRGSRAGTTLRRAMNILLAPTGRARKIFRQLGLTFVTTEGKLQSLSTIIGKLNRANLTAAQTTTIFGRIAGPGMSALLFKGSQALDNFKDSLENSTGAAFRMSQEFRTSVIGRTKDLRSSVINLGLAFSQEFKKPLADTIFSVRNYVKNITEALQKTGIFKSIVSGVISAFSPFTKVFKAGAETVKEFLLALSPSDITDLFDILKQKFQDFIDKVVESKSSIISFFKGAKVSVMLFINAIISLAKGFDKLPNSLKTVAASMAGFSATLLALTGGIVNIIGFLIIMKFIIIPLTKGMWGLTKATAAMGFAAKSASISSVFLSVALSPITLTVLGIVASVGAAVVAFRILAEIIDKFAGTDLAGSFDRTFKELGGTLLKSFSDVISKIKNMFSVGFGKVKDNITTNNLFSNIPKQAKVASEEANKALSNIGNIAVMGSSNNTKKSRLSAGDRAIASNKSNLKFKASLEGKPDAERIKLIAERRSARRSKFKEESDARMAKATEIGNKLRKTRERGQKKLANFSESRNQDRIGSKGFKEAFGERVSNNVVTALTNLTDQLKRIDKNLSPEMKKNVERQILDRTGVGRGKSASKIMSESLFASARNKVQNEALGGETNSLVPSIPGLIDSGTVGAKVNNSFFDSSNKKNNEANPLEEAKAKIQKATAVMQDAGQGMSIVGTIVEEVNALAEEQARQTEILKAALARIEAVKSSATVSRSVRDDIGSSSSGAPINQPGNK